DTGATKDSHWLGWEWDVFCDWRITSDLTWTVRYGAFRPGAAYQNDDCRDFVYTAFTYSF
ncbi:MAG TPA: alginate export family protein, partial [Phycisphaerae bacterium]|nr:alginate export family protein [Phycisphaerae bacterium]